MNELIHALWTKETVQKILEEYKASRHDYLCVGSKTFDNLFYLYGREITSIALAWRPEETMPYKPGNNHQLFNTCNKQLRLAFLNHCLSLLK